MNWGNIIKATCENIPSPPDSRCEDLAFALSNPAICPVAPFLVIKPAVFLTCTLGSVQLRAVFTKDGAEEDVTDETTFTSSDPAVAVVGASSGNATGVAAGTTTFRGVYNDGTQEHEAFTTINVLGENCCEDQSVAIMVCVDNSRSMSQAFGSGYETKLSYAKAAAIRFINEVNESKDIVGLLKFNDALTEVLSEPITDKAAVSALVPAIPQTQQLTSFHEAITQAVSSLNGVSADRRILVIISDGEDSTASYNDTNNPISAAEDFKSTGGIVMCLGVRAHGRGFQLLSRLSTGGFFVNGYGTTAAAALNYLSGLKGYVCAGNCVPEGDEYVPTGTLNYNGFSNWDVEEGYVDLQGAGFFDYLPGNGMYVDLISGAQPSGPANGILELKDAMGIVIEAGKSYRLTVTLAGNQQVDRVDTVNVRVFWKQNNVEQTEVNIISQTIALTDFTSGFADYSYAFTADAGYTVFFAIQQSNVPTGAYARAGALLGQVRFDDVTDMSSLFNDTFDTENLTYVPPACGTGTTPIAPRVRWANTSGFLETLETVSWPDGTPVQFETIPGVAGFPTEIQAGVTYYVSLESAPTLYFIYPTLADALAHTNQIALGGTGDPVQEYYALDQTPGNQSYETGYYGCYGTGCLEEPPPEQLQDTDPLNDIEKGTSPPTIYTSTKTKCATCPDDFQNIPLEDAVPTMTSATAPSGTVFSSSGAAVGFEAWRVFDDNASTYMDLVGVIAGHVGYQFTSGKTITHYTLQARSDYALSAPGTWTFEGSNNGTAWTVLDTRSNISWYAGESKPFGFNNTTSYTYYRLNITSNMSGLATSNLDLAGFSMSGFEGESTEVCATATETSESSQQDADNKANAAALEAAEALLNCNSIYSATTSYTAHCPVGTTGAAVTRSETRTSFVSQSEADAAALAAAQASAEADLSCAGSNNTQPINIGHAIGPASPYPSVLNISGYDELFVITKVTLTLNKFAANVNLLQYVSGILVSPSGTAVNFFRKIEHDCTVPIELDPFATFPFGPERVNSITFDDDAVDPFPTCPPFPPGDLHEDADYTFQPTVDGAAADLPAPAPAGPYAVTLATFIGESPNGSWSLWFSVETEAELGAVVGQGWSLTIT